MSSRTLTGLLLIVGPIVLLAGIIPMFSSLGDVDWGDASKLIPAAGKNAGLLKAAIPVAPLDLLG